MPLLKQPQCRPRYYPSGYLDTFHYRPVCANNLRGSLGICANGQRASIEAGALKSRQTAKSKQEPKNVFGTFLRVVFSNGRTSGPVAHAWFCLNRDESVKLVELKPSRLMHGIASFIRNVPRLFTP